MSSSHSKKTSLAADGTITCIPSKPAGRSMSKKRLIFSIIFIGSIMMGAAVFANQLGLHTGAHWGLGRKILLTAGGLVFTGGIIYGLSSQINHFFVRLSSSTFVNTCLVPMRKIAGWISQSRLFRWLGSADPKLALWSAVPVMVAVIAAYLWIVSVGSWTAWPSTTTYYDELAFSFLNGHTYLPDTPDPHLASLANPYDFSQRQTLSIPWDVSYYKNHYYLYWGPTPAVLLAPLKSFIHFPIRDDFLVFFFTSGSFILSANLIFLLWRYYFNQLPWWVTSIGIFIAGLVNPLPWLLSRPAIYEAAISSGQFFLLAGLTAVLTVLMGNMKSYQVKAGALMAVGAACWALAIGSRATLAAPILFLTVLTVWRIYRTFPDVRKIGLALIAPLLVGVVLLGWYNLARFDSILEFGHRYQLTGIDQNTNYTAIVSLANLPPNLYNYLANPFRTLPVFPFVKPQIGGHYIFFYIHAPKLYYTEQVVGIIPSAPFILLALVPAFLALKKLLANPGLISREALTRNLTGRLSGAVPHEAASPGAAFIALAFSGGSIAALVPLLVFLVCSMRYAADFVPLLTLTAVFGYWQGIQALVNKPLIGLAWKIAGIALAILSAGLGMLLGVTGYGARFELINPVLFDQLTRFFAR